MANTAQRRFVELGVNEVSLVDSAANELEFAVIKSLNAQQEETMSDDKSTTVNKDADGQDTEEVVEEEVEKVQVEVPEPSDDIVQKAMDKVAATVEAIAKAAGISVDADEDAAETEKAKKSPIGGSGIRELFISKLKGLGMKGDDLKKATEDFDKAAKALPPWLEGKGKGKAKVKKDDDTAPVEKAAPESDTLSLLEQLTTEIEKAKRFTPKRADQLKSAIATLAKLADELSDGAQKAQLPGNTQMGDSGIKEITKAIEELTEVFKGQMGEVVETNKSLVERVETIEKERQPTQSVEEDGGTDAEVETEKGLWSGLL